jgi:NADH-quinone oxidoreductase subunit C
MAIDHPAVAKLKGKFPDAKFQGSQFRGDMQIAVPAQMLTSVITFLRDEPSLGYNMLSDVSCVDYLNFPGAKDRFGLVYVLNSVDVGATRLIVRVFLNEPEIEVDSLVPLFAGAEWLEREVYDMFGIKFRNHPDLRRVLTWDGFKDHPLRKDYPVTGKGERENYPILSRDSA